MSKTPQVSPDTLRAPGMERAPTCGVWRRILHLPRFGILLAFILLVVVAVAAAGRPLAGEWGTGVEPAPDLSAYPWFYRRDGRPLAGDEGVVEVIAVGDVMLGRGVAGEPDPLGGVAAWLRPAGLALGNLESVIVAGGVPPAVPPGAPQPYILNAPLTAVAALRRAGFDLLGLANNHTLDYGPAGLLETAGRLQSAGITPLGAAAGSAIAYQPIIREVNGLRLAFLAFNAVAGPSGFPHPSALRADWDAVQATAAIAQARALSDAVIVSIHWGYEYELRPDPAQEAAAQAMLAAGADVIVGHHPHVVQPVVVGLADTTQPARATLVAYSLGNFAFDQGWDETGRGLALRLFFDARGLRAAQALPVRAGPRPQLLAMAAATSLLDRVAPPLRRLAFACDGEHCQPAAAPPAAGPGLFWSGEIDLTGDGQPEVVRRAAGRVTVYQAGQAAWQSPPEWWVVDVALGDPNDDGRGELMLAIWQVDAAGYERSQPYVVGYRGGAYKLLWGGRPVVDPIQELELGDVDGDGVQELVVLEELDGGPGRAVAVWRWAGWTFSLVWRSPIGNYQELALIPGIDGQPALITIASEW
ncbi:MAG: CapA family protein [Chloroflexi bacterium]|nr:CapA family protein [Chloroflexota bacterium]MCI0729520.1 CapA family protein [Chloroflexota bacterium]